MDMWPAYFTATSNYLPKADSKIVFDWFHVMQHVCKAVDKVRRQEHKQLMGQGDDRLKGSKYLWLYSKDNLPSCHHDRFTKLKDAALNTAKAWAMKETLQNLWGYLSPGWALRFLDKWCRWAVRVFSCSHARSLKNASRSCTEHSHILPSPDHKRYC